VSARVPWTCPQCRGDGRRKEILGFRVNLYECVRCGWRWIR